MKGEMKLAYIMDCQPGCRGYIGEEEYCGKGNCTGCPLDYEGRKVTKLGFLWYCITASIYQGVMRLTCRIKGHDFVDTSYATPDTGAMGLECRRCGFGGTTILY